MGAEAITKRKTSGKTTKRAKAKKKAPALKTRSAKSKNGAVATNWFRIGYLIHDVSRLRRTLYDQHLKPLGITRSQWWVLANISRHPQNGVVSSVLARDLDIGKVTLGGLIDRLEEAGYVYRRNHKLDGRAKEIFISEKGYELIEEMKNIVEPLNMKSCEGLSQKQIEEVEFGLNVIKRNLKDMLGEGW